MPRARSSAAPGAPPTDQSTNPAARSGGIEALRAQVQARGAWFHNLRLGPGGAVQTAPDHPLGDFPSNFWQFFQHVIPNDLRGKSVLDIGCNGGFYSLEMARRGASRVLAVDHDPVYLAQAEFARDQSGFDQIELRLLDVYDVDRIQEQFDLVLFLGVLYHLRHPLYALEKVAALVRGQLLFQTMERGAWETAEYADDYPITEKDVFFDDRFPRMYFVEQKYAGDPTNWWIPNPSATAAMLRSVGMRIVERPCHEVYLCEPNPNAAGSAGQG